jgi:phosphatidylglycerophosphatase A
MTTSGKPRKQPSTQFVFAHPAHFIAFGFGSGLAPVAPGTVGTALGFFLYYGLANLLPDQALIAVIGLSFVIGVWACDVTGRDLGVHDHGGMVWDEIVAMMLVLFFIPAGTVWQAAAFVLFRFFDIAKPPPIHSLDRGIRNGFGVMFDDIVAALYALLVLAAWQQFQGEFAGLS